MRRPVACDEVVTVSLGSASIVAFACDGQQAVLRDWTEVEFTEVVSYRIRGGVRSLGAFRKAHVRHGDTPNVYLVVFANGKEILVSDLVVGQEAVVRYTPRARGSRQCTVIRQMERHGIFDL